MAHKRKQIPFKIREKLFADCNGLCTYCGCILVIFKAYLSNSFFEERRVAHIDHIKPLAKGGLDDVSNYQILCDKCNLSKGVSYDS